MKTIIFLILALSFSNAQAFETAFGTIGPDGISIESENWITCEMKDFCVEINEDYIIFKRYHHSEKRTSIGLGGLHFDSTIRDVVYCNDIKNGKHCEKL